MVEKFSKKAILAKIADFLRNLHFLQHLQAIPRP
jgi:hypothetical protein